ncbi:retrovirus-related pol polyprotein from transposon TNT 1-94 [Tanacetum coccineum]
MWWQRRRYGRGEDVGVGWWWKRGDRGGVVRWRIGGDVVSMWRRWGHRCGVPNLVDRWRGVAAGGRKLARDGSDVVVQCRKYKGKRSVCLRTCLEPDEWIKDSGCSKHMTSNKSLFSTYKAYDEDHVDNLAFNLLSVGQICDNKCQALFTEEGSEIIKDGKTIENEIRKTGLYLMKLGNKSQDKLCLATVVDNSTLWHRRLGHANMRLIQSLSSKELLPLSQFIKTPYEIFRGRKPSLEYLKVFGSKCFILNTKDYLTKFDPKSYEGVFLGYSQNSKAYVVLNKHTMKVEKSLNVTFDESPPPTKLSSLVDDDVGEEEAIRKNIKLVNTNNEEDESIKVDEIFNIKESKNHPLDQVIGNPNKEP